MKKLFIPLAKILGFYIFIGLIIRTVLFFLPITNGFFSLLDCVKIFSIGIVNDFCISILIFSLFWLYLIFLSNSKYKSPWGYIILGLLVTAWLFLFFFRPVFDEYGKIVSILVLTLAGLKVVSFSSLLFFPMIRKKWRYFMYCSIFFIYISLIIYNAVGEFLFWNEFGTRYNFIAVDSLIYTDGIKGNGLDSYPIVPMVSILTLISLVITIFFVKKDKNKFEEFPNFKIKLANAFIYIGMIVGAFFLLKFTQEQETSDNDFVNELQANGLYRFYNAYNQGSLSYDKLYAKLPEEKAFSIVNKQYGNPEQKENNVKIIKDSIPEIRKNVVVITMEGMNSNFMKYFGNASNLTPNLNKLAEEGMFFTNFYSVGDQTVKGLEALTLCIPPSPGRSLIRRENNTNLFSTGYLFKKRGYTVQFLYGGYGSFNNMETFFEGNGYQVIDRGSFSQEEITFTNTSGVCDEDLFNKAIKNFDADYKKGNPFFGHIMTVSNHRPFTFPKRKIALSSGKNSHAGSIKYTDYAIGKFIKEAQKHSWFSNTVFVFVAGCRTSTSETTEIHPNEYHIPAIIYAPGFIQPEKVTVLTSQIDLMPTLLGKLHFSYTSHFYGQDVFNSNYQPRVFMSTYQKLGYLKDNTLTVLSPNQKTDQFTVGVKGQMNKNDKKNKTLSEEAIANYQTASYLIKNNLLKIK